MAVTLTRFLVAAGKDQVGGLTTVDGLTSVKIRRVDFDYNLGDGRGVINICRQVTLDYTPTGNPPNAVPVDWYDWGQKYVTVRFVFTQNNVLVTRTYNMIVLDVILSMDGASQDHYQIFLGQTKEELNKSRTAQT